MEDTRGYVMLEDGRKECFPDGLPILHRGSIGKLNILGFNDRVTEIAIPSTVFLIDRDCFRDCKLLRKVSFAPSKNGRVELAAIMERAFQGCGALDSFDFDVAPITFIGENAFANTGFSQLDLSYNDSLSYIGAFAFSGCTKLMKAAIRSEVIAANCFAECKSLIKLELKDCQYVGSNAFIQCNDLTKVESRGGKSIEHVAPTGNKDFINALKT